MNASALADLKVLDFGWIAAVPILTQQLSLHGADVVRIESSSRPDASRTSSPFIDEARTVSAAFGQLNTNKRSIGVDIKQPDARAVVLDLVEWADVVTENFRPGTLKRLGFGYEVLAARNPRIVMLQSSSAGQTGPLSTMAATGDLLQSLCGFTHMTGFADEHPMPPWGAWTDITVPPIGVAAILAAVRQARATGQGILLDMSQMELSVAFLADQVVEAQLGGPSPTRAGNRDGKSSPHGVFRAAGEDRWLAISATDDEQWTALAGAIGRPDLAEKYPSLEERRAAEDELERALDDWTSGIAVETAFSALTKLGIPCAIVSDSREVLEDRQLAHRDFFQHTEHPVVGPIMVPVSAFILSETPARAISPAPEIGRDSWEICTDVLGYPAERVAELMGVGVIE